VETFLPAAPPVVDLDDVKNERQLFVVAGGTSDFVERDGTRYVVIPSDATSFREGTTALPDCQQTAERGCVDRTGPNPIARLRDGAQLDFPGGFLTITQGPPRQLDVEVLLSR
jgi:hypothetical protein